MDERLAESLAEVLAAVEAGEAVNGEWLSRRYPGEAEELGKMLALTGLVHAHSTQRLGPYELIREIGAGATGIVYLARTVEDQPDLGSGEEVALKVIHPHLMEDEGAVERFLQEARLGARVRHANVVRTYGCGTATLRGRTAVYHAQQYVAGRTLRELMEDLGSVPESLCRHVGKELCCALSAIHSAGAVHRDLKPENVILTGAEQVKLMDLGAALARSSEEEKAQGGAFMGSAWYAAPEQLRSDPVDGRADLFALGLVLAELATGRHRLLGRGSGERDSPLSLFFEEVIETLLAVDPAARFATATELAHVLEEGESSDWWRARSAKVPPRRVRVRRDTGMYGREAPIRHLLDAFNQVQAGEGAALLVEGEAGVGKSRLVDEFLEALRAEERDFRLLFGLWHPEGNVRDAFGGALQEHFRREGTESIPRLLEGAVPLVEGLVRYLEPVSGGPETDERAVETAMIRVLRSLAKERPIVFVVEDLHFADGAAWERFRSFSRGLLKHRVLLLGTARPGPEGASGEGPFQVIGLEGVSEEAQAEIASEFLSPRRLDAPLAETLSRSSGGNPFFLLEMLRGLVDRGALDEDTRGVVTLRPGIALDVPDAVGRAVAARIAEVSSDHLSLLRAAACAGNEFDPALLAAALKRSLMSVLTGLTEIATRHRLVRPIRDRFRFDHHVVHQVLYDAVPTSERKRYHDAIARALEDRAPGPVSGETAFVVCDHTLKAGLPDRARPCMREALAFARRTHAYVACGRMCEALLASEGVLTGAERVEVMLHHVAALEARGAGSVLESVLNEALGVARAEELGEHEHELLLGLVRLHRTRGDWSRVEGLLTEAAGLAETLGGAYPARVQVEAGQTCFDRGTFEDARRFFAATRVQFAEAEDRDGEVEALHGLGRSLAFLGRIQEAVEIHEEELEICAELNDRRQRARAVGGLGHACHRLGDVPRARRLVAEERQLMREVGDRPGEAQACALLCKLTTVTDGSEAAWPLLEDALRLFVEMGDDRGELSILAMTCRALHDQGRYAESIDALKRIERLAQDLSDLPALAIGYCNSAMCYGQMGAWELFRTASDKAAALCREMESELGANSVRIVDLYIRMDGDEDPAALLREFTEFLPDLRRVGNTCDLCRALHAIIELSLRLDRNEGVEEALAEADKLQRADFASRAVSAIFHLHLGRVDVEEAVGQARECRKGLSLRWWVKLNYLLWAVTQEGRFLREAHGALLELRALCPPEFQDTILTKVRVNREIVAAARQL